VNELLEGKKQSEVANNYGITQGAVSQKWGDFQNELLEKYENGISKQTLIEEQVKKGINLTIESLNEIIPEDFNKLIIGDCLKELPNLQDESIDCVVIDPPYGIDYQSNHKKENMIRLLMIMMGYLRC